jgi:hypothetical protein
MHAFQLQKSPCGFWALTIFDYRLVKASAAKASTETAILAGGDGLMLLKLDSDTNATVEWETTWKLEH